MANRIELCAMKPGVRRLTTILVSMCALAMFGCSDDSSNTDRTSTPLGGNDSGREGGLTEAGVDVNGGRDDTAASCFAACENTAFTCQAKSGTTVTVTEAELTP